MPDAIAERELVWVKPNGERVAVTLRIGRPYRVNGSDWACPVSAEGFHDQLADIHGIDSFQALVLAQGLLANLMARAIEDGGRFLHADDDTPVDVGRLFAAGI
jgi:hypothetical protein